LFQVVNSNEEKILLPAASPVFPSLQTLAGGNLHLNLIDPQYAIPACECEGQVKGFVREAAAKPESLQVKLQMQIIRADLH
jgi:hypothetical protein